MKFTFKLPTVWKGLGFLALALMLPLSINTVEAAKPDKCGEGSTHPSCGDSDEQLKLPFSVAIIEHEGDVFYNSPLYKPSSIDGDCLAMAHNHRANYDGFFPYNDGNECETLLTTDPATALVDLVGFSISRDKKTGAIISAVIQGQDHVDMDLALLHVSEEMVDPNSPIPVEYFGDGSFIIHLHADDVMLYKCDTNGERNPTCEIEAGTFAIEDLFYEYR